MAKTVLLNCRAFAVGVDLTGNSNKIEIAAEAEEKEKTNYGSQGWKEVLGGIRSGAVQAEGQWEAGGNDKVDDASWAALGGIGPWTIAPVSASVGELAYLLRAHRADYKLGGAVGDVAPWSGKASSTWPIARGLMGHPPGTARTATGTGTGVQLGAVTAGKRLYATLHVLSVSGGTPSLTVRVESSADNTFVSPTTQLTFAAATGISGQVLRTDGSAISDTWWRFAWTISGSTPSVLFPAAFGIA